MPSKRPNGWLGRYRDADGNERSRLFREVDGAPKRKAINWEQEQAAAVRRGTDIDPRAGKVKVREYAATWQAAQLHHRPKTAYGNEGVFRNHVLPHIGGRQVSAVRPDEIRALVALWAAEGVLPATVAARYKLVRAMFQSAVDGGLIGRTPCRGVRLPEQVDTPVVPLTAEQVRTLIAAVPPDERPVVIVGAGLGVRIGEALGLTVDRVQFLRREVVIDRQADDRNPDLLTPRKNGRRHPRYVVPLPDYVAAELSKLKANADKNPDGRLFLRPDGSVMSARRLQMVIRQTVARAGLPAGTSFHDLRHAYASRLIEHGESVVTVAARIGDSAGTVLKYYGHLFPDSDERTRKIIDGLFAEDVDQMRTSGSSAGG